VLQTALELPVNTSAATCDARQVQYSIQVIEDRDGCMAEYKELRDGTPIMCAESKTLLPAIRMLCKAELIRQLSAPRIICTAGQTAQVEISNDATPQWKDLWLVVGSNKAPNGLTVELGLSAKGSCEPLTSLQVESGKTIVLNFNDPPSAHDDAEQNHPAVYIVLTPEIVK
jgi:hypothetical protein